jgi:hypothetical protein
MKKSIQATKQRAHQHTPTKTVAPRQGPSSAKFWAVLGLCLAVATGGTWALMEFVVWNKLPSELVGTWEVVQGPPEYKEAVFTFYRDGKLVGRLNDKGNLRIMNAQVDVNEYKIYITTRQPSTGKEYVSVQSIRTLNEREVVVADAHGSIMKMTRIP